MIDPFEKNKKDIQTIGEKERLGTNHVIKEYLMYEKAVRHQLRNRRI